MFPAEKNSALDKQDVRTEQIASLDDALHSPHIDLYMKWVLGIEHCRKEEI